MVRIESTRACVRTPVLLLALEEAGRPYVVEHREEGWFDAHHGQAGPVVHVGDEVHVGLDAMLELVRTLPSLRPDDPAAVVRSDAWFVRLRELRPVIARVASARRQGVEPDAEDLGTVRRMIALLDAETLERPWVGGERLSAADVALTVLGGATRMGLPLPPRVHDLLVRLQARATWARVREVFPAAVALEVA